MRFLLRSLPVARVLLALAAPLAFGLPGCTQDAADDDANAAAATTGADESARNAAALLQSIVTSAGADDGTGAAPLGSLSAELGAVSGPSRTFHVHAVRPTGSDPFVDVPIDAYLVLYDQGAFVYKAGGVAWLDQPQAALTDAAREFSTAAAGGEARAQAVRPRDVTSSLADSILEKLLPQITKAIEVAVKSAEQNGTIKAAATFVKAEATAIGTALEEGEAALEKTVSEHVAPLATADKKVVVKAIGTNVAGKPSEVAAIQKAADALAASRAVSGHVYVGDAAKDILTSAKSRVFVDYPRGQQSLVDDWGAPRNVRNAAADFADGLSEWASRAGKTTRTFISYEPSLLKDVAAGLKSRRIFLTTPSVTRALSGFSGEAVADDAIVLGEYERGFNLYPQVTRYQNGEELADELLIPDASFTTVDNAIGFLARGNKVTAIAHGWVPEAPGRLHDELLDKLGDKLNDRDRAAKIIDSLFTLIMK